MMRVVALFAGSRQSGGCGRGRSPGGRAQCSSQTHPPVTRVPPNCDGELKLRNTFEKYSCRGPFNSDRESKLGLKKQGQICDYCCESVTWKYSTIGWFSTVQNSWIGDLVTHSFLCESLFDFGTKDKPIIATYDDQPMVGSRHWQFFTSSTTFEFDWIFLHLLHSWIILKFGDNLLIIWFFCDNYDIFFFGQIVLFTRI